MLFVDVAEARGTAPAGAADEAARRRASVARSARARGGADAGHELPSTGTVSPDGPHRRQPADARLRDRLRAAGGRPDLPHPGGQAQAVPAHRPGRMHPLRGLRRHLPVEVHPHGLDRRRSPTPSTPSSPATTPKTTSSSSSTKTSAPAAPSASTAAPPASSSSARSPTSARRRPPRPHQPARLRLRRPVLSHGTRGAGSWRTATAATDNGHGSRREGRDRRSRRSARRSAARRRGTRSSGPARSSGAATPTAPATAPT